MNLYFFLDYYCLKLDEEDIFGDDVNAQRLINKWFQVCSISLGVATVLTVIFYGFSVNVYYFEQKALKKKQEKWRRRINQAFENQGVAPDVATAIADDVLSGKSCQIVVPNK